MTMQKAKPPKITGDQRLRAPVPPGITSWTDINTGPGDDVAQNVAAANDAVIEHLSNLCVELGLGMSIRHATPEVSRRFFIILDDRVLLAADDPGQIEYYLYGWRDGSRSVTDQL